MEADLEISHDVVDRAIYITSWTLLDPRVVRLGGLNSNLL